MVVPQRHVIRLNTASDVGGQRVNQVVIEGAQPLPVSPDAKVIIALGTVESARVALLSFGSDGKIGRNLMAHLRSNVDIRVPRAALAALPATSKALEASALFICLLNLLVLRMDRVHAAGKGGWGWHRRRAGSRQRMPTRSWRIGG
jgi:hypothetical protein